MSQLAEYVLLGILQGATEFLPVSSSGHLLAAETLLSIERPGLVLEVSLHFGTLVVIVLMFRRELVRLVADFSRGAWLLVRGNRQQIAQRAPLFGMALAIIIGTVPAALVGVLAHDAIGRIFEGNLRLAGVCLVVTGAVLLASRLAPRGEAKDVSPGKGFGIGCAQAVALLPGISRSGATIVAGYFCGLERSAAARFSFLLAVPAMLGAMVLETAGALGAAGEATVRRSDVLPLLCGMLVAALVGWACLALLLKVVQSGKLHWFSAYCLPVGALLFALSFAR